VDIVDIIISWDLKAYKYIIAEPVDPKEEVNKLN